MPKHYGFPYKGSKDKIAEDIIGVLPSGRRLIDLFGGGGAISHCAVESGKWEQVVYNDINPLNKRLIDEAIAGKYSYKNFTPEFITHEHFMRERYNDGYIGYIWSFGNNGRSYAFGRDIEILKHAVHDYVVFGEWSDKLEPWRDCNIYPLEHEVGDIMGRRAEWTSKVKRGRDRLELETLERLERLQQLERIERLETLERLERLLTLCMDYREYEYQDGDVVYCDIPYQNAADKGDTYGKGFDFGAFYNWAVSSPFPVYFSSYALGDCAPGVEVWRKSKRITFRMEYVHDRTEVMYCVDNHYHPNQNGRLFL